MTLKNGIRKDFLICLPAQSLESAYSIKTIKSRHGGSIYNPSYSGGRDQEDNDLRPVWAKS
jgi:hypothetical protein